MPSYTWDMCTADMRPAAPCDVSNGEPKRKMGHLCCEHVRKAVQGAAISLAAAANERDRCSAFPSLSGRASFQFSSSVPWHRLLWLAPTECAHAQALACERISSGAPICHTSYPSIYFVRSPTSHGGSRRGPQPTTVTVLGGRFLNVMHFKLVRAKIPMAQREGTSSQEW